VSRDKSIDLVFNGTVFQIPYSANGKIDLINISEDQNKLVTVICPKNHEVNTTIKVLKDEGCPRCYMNSEAQKWDTAIQRSFKTKQPLETMNKDMWDEIFKKWEINAERDSQVEDRQMYSSFADRRIQSLALNSLAKFKTLKKMESNLGKLEQESEVYERKTDLSNSAIKRFAKGLDNSTSHHIQRNEEIISEIKFMGNLALAGLWHTFVAWNWIENPEIIESLGEKYTDKAIYIQAIVFPKDIQSPYTVIYPTFKSKAELLSLARQSSAFDHSLLELKKTQKIIMMQFNHCEGSADNINDLEYDIKEFRLKKRIPINTIQERFAYTRNYLCGLSQNKLAFWLNEKGITIDQKGVKYWEEKETDEPSFIKNHWDDVLSVLAEFSYPLLRHPIQRDLEKSFGQMDYKISIESVKMLLEDFILYGTEDANRYSIPDLIKNTTEMTIKSEADLLWEQASNRSMIQIKADPLSEKDVAENTSILTYWFKRLLEKTESEILSDLDDVYGKNTDHKKQVFYIWHKVNEQYGIEYKKTLEKQNEGKKPPFS